MGVPFNKSGLIFVLFLFLFLSTGCITGRYVFWNYADVNDQHRFPSDTVRRGPVSSDLIRSTRSAEISFPSSCTVTESPPSLGDFLETHQTLAFLVLQNDSLIFERYYGTYDSASLLPSFSVVKSFVSSLTCIAIGEGYIRDVHQPVTDYLYELKDTIFRKVTIENLLTMRSGIRFRENYNSPFYEMAKFYYGRDLKRYTRKLRVIHPPDSTYEYQSGNAQLLGMIIEKATGRKISGYIQDRIWQPMGMESDATWNVDSRKNREIKAFCCLNATARDFARFGLLYLHQGNWNGKSIVPEEWVRESLTIRNDSRDSQGYPYGYMWRVLEDGSFFAKGILGEYIFVCPEKNAVIVRLGAKAGDVNWVEFFRCLAKELP